MLMQVTVNISSMSFGLADTCLSHDFAGKVVRNVLVAVLRKCYSSFRAVPGRSLFLPGRFEPRFKLVMAASAFHILLTQLIHHDMLVINDRLMADQRE